MSADLEFTAPRFGTDGLRGHAGRPPLDPETLRRIGAALAIWLQGSGPDPKRVVLASDGRESSDWIHDALSAGLAAGDVVSVDLGLATTPALAHVTRSQPFVAGIMISASHNPASDNGIKIFAADGTKLADAAEARIAALTESVEFGELPSPRVKRRAELLDGYVEHLANAFPGLDLSDCRLVVDAANGGGSALVPGVLRSFGAEVVEVACAPNGTNINAGVGALHPESVVETVRRERALLGICLDGDGDRGIFVDDGGAVRDGDAVLAAMAPHLRERGQLPADTVVATVMSNLGLRKALQRHAIEVHTTPVGDRSVVAAMREHGYGLGGEQSGHIVFAGPGEWTGDGLFTALQLLSLPEVRSRGSAPVFAGFERFPQRLINVEVARKPDLSALPAVQAAVAAAERELGDDGRVVLRYSGTEDLCRVMVEAPTDAEVDRHARDIAAVVEREIG